MCNIGERIQSMLEKNNMTQRDLAKKVGVTEVTISRYINGSREPKGEIVARIAKCLNVSSDYLLGNINDAAPQSKRKKQANTNNTLDVSGLPEEAVKQVEDYIGYLKQKYNTNGHLNKE